MKYIANKYPLILVTALIVLGVVNISVNGTTLEVAEQDLSVQLLDYPVHCQQVTDIEEFEDFGCYHCIIRADCWRGGWDLPCFEGIQYILECPGDDPIIVGEFTVAQSCKEPA